MGRRWRDLDESATPLGALSVATQYRDEPLKTKTPRVVPVHPVLAGLLTVWKRSGFQQFFPREHRPEDFIVPSCTWKCGLAHMDTRDTPLPDDDVFQHALRPSRAHRTRSPIPHRYPAHPRTTLFRRLRAARPTLSPPSPLSTRTYPRAACGTTEAHVKAGSLACRLKRGSNQIPCCNRDDSEPRKHSTTRQDTRRAYAPKVPAPSRAV